MPGTAADAAALEALALPAVVRGAAFKKGDGALYVLWAKTEGDESATASFDLAATGSVTVHTFTLDGGEQKDEREPKDGKVTLALRGMPTVIEAP